MWYLAYFRSSEWWLRFRKAFKTSLLKKMWRANLKEQGMSLGVAHQWRHAILHTPSPIVTPFSTKALLQSSQNPWPPPHYIIMTPENIHRFSKINSLNSRKKIFMICFRNQVLPNPDNRNEPGRFPEVANDYNRQTSKRQMECDDSDDSDDSTTEESEVAEDEKKFQCNICQTCFTARW